MRKAEVKESEIFYRVLLLAVIIFLIDVSIFAYVYGDFNNGITGFSIKETFSRAYIETPLASKVLLGAQWSLLIFALFLAKSKHSQAAMEFMMTYGWAILAAAIVIAALVAFGAFSPGEYIQTECSLNPPVVCDRNQVSATSSGDAISLVVRNGAGQSITLNSVAIDDCGINNNDGKGWATGEGETQLIMVKCITSLAEGSKIKKDVSVKYTVSGGSLAMDSSGSLTVQVGP